jgi:hypothetical protein
MKRFLIIAAVAMVFASCGKEVNGIVDDENGEKRVTFNLEGNWNSPVFTRGSLSADGKEMTDLWLFDYVDGTLVQSLHQVSTDADFGEPSPTLTYGQHKIYFVVSRGVSPSVSGNVISWSSVRDTFWKSLSVSVGSSSASYSVTMERVVTKLKITATDAVPDGTATVVVLPGTWYAGLDYLTGQPAEMRDNEEMSAAVPDSYVGTTGLAVSFFGFSSATEWTTPLTVSARDGQNDIIGLVNVAAAPFMANRATEYSGSLFTSGGAFAITLNDEWDTPWTGSW